MISIKRDNPGLKSIEKLINLLLENEDVGIQFVAVVDNTIVGFSTLYMSYSTLNIKKQSTLNDLYILETYRGYSIGEKLFERCVSYSKENDCSAMIWETSEDNHGAQKLYDRLGGVKSEWVHYEMDF
ncbi:N-acetyltransferase family protein [Enterococcus sp. AZ192]|uniref:GNAT family N-acetyltransferase n=1 Tax=unclassified Enterococcus TaxID=2608891 RepID=UPI003D2652BC